MECQYSKKEISNENYEKNSTNSFIYSVSEFFGGGYKACRILLPLAALMAFANPLAVVYDDSYLFTVLGVLGIIFIFPKIVLFLKNKNITFMIKNLFNFEISDIFNSVRN